MDAAVLGDYQRVDFFAYFLIAEMGQDHFLVSEIAECFEACSLAPPASLKTYISRQTAVKPRKYLKAPRGYRLEKHARDILAKRLGGETHTVQVPAELRQLETRIPEGPGKEWLKEALDCFGVEAYRATLIMIWLYVLDHLFEYILTHHLADFNAALASHPDQRAVKKVGSIRHRDDFGTLGEELFLDLCRSAKVISPDVRKILGVKLGIRNSAAHPSGITITRHKCVEFAEDLILNVVLKHRV